jgi:hypothetical protein
MTIGFGADIVARLKPYSLGAAILVAGLFLGACGTSASSSTHSGPSAQANVTHSVSVNALGNNEIEFSILWYNAGKAPGASDCVLDIDEPDGNFQTYDVSTTGGIQALANGVIQPTDSNQTNMTVTVTPGQASLITPGDFHFSLCRG